MVAGALLSDSFAVLALACYILVCLHAIMGLLSVDGSRHEPQDRASRTAEPQLGPASRLRLVQAGRVRVAAPARPVQITSAKGRKKPDLLLPKKLPAERAFGRSASALLDAATLPAVQATAHITDPAKPCMRRSASETSLGVNELSAKQTGRKTPLIAIHAAGRPTVLDRMMENTREAPKTPGAPPTPPTLIRFRSKGPDSAGACGLTNPAKPSMRRSASETSLGVIELSATQSGRNKAKTPPEREIAIHGGVLARRLAFKLQRVEERLALAWRAESLQRGVAVDASVPDKKASGWHSKPSMQTSSELSLGVIELSPNSALRHPASPFPQGTGSKDSRRGSSLGIKSSRERGPSVSSSSRFYANVVTRRVGMQSGNAL